MDMLMQLESRIKAGQQEFAGIMGELLRRFRPDVVSLFEHRDQTYVLEPFLFTYFSLPDGPRRASLDQIIAGHLPASRRPDRIPAVADRTGVVHLPGAGYVEATGSAVQLRCVPGKQGAAWYQVQDSGVERRPYRPCRLVNGDIEVMSHGSPLVAALFDASDEKAVETIAASSELCAVIVQNSLDIIGNVWPELHGILTSVLRRVVLFESAASNSFATTRAQGTVFCNIGLGRSEAFFIEDLAHQGGHVAFAAATLDQEAYFRVPSGTTVGELTGEVRDRRSLYVALHGIFTEALMSHCLALCLERRVFEDACRQHELLGRFNFIFARFTSDLRLLSELGVFAADGRELMAQLCVIWTDLTIRHASRLGTVDLAGQGYNFSYERFSQLNPIGARG
ncbi:hypothetical protein ABT144_24265 [Streptomyces sp. NPDC002039]|uniref:hypothetical protein n=1 Tax=Streptomyces sp. NPDC002039 TaxID=3154660 RepID=UPI0033196D24